MTSHLISIIVPVYNTEKYLDQCIQSVLAQTYTNWELLLIDDGSTDSSGAICDRYAAEDSRIRVFHKENGGVSSARNLGLDNAKGEWITFVDADDYTDAQYVEKLYSGNKYDYITCYWDIINCHSFVGIPPKEEEYLTPSQIRRFLDKNIQRLSYPVCRLYNLSIIKQNQIRFDETISFSEDALFNLEYITHVSSVKQIGDVLYYYEKHEGSLSNRHVSWAELNRAIIGIGTCIDNLKKRFDWNGECLLQYFVWGVLLRKYFTYIQLNESFEKCVNGLKTIYNNPYVQRVFQPSKQYTKSRFRIVFDYLMRSNLWSAAAIVLKLEGLLIKHGIATRK